MSGIYILGMEMPQPKFADMATVYYLVCENCGPGFVIKTGENLEEDT